MKNIYLRNSLFSSHTFYYAINIDMWYVWSSDKMDVFVVVVVSIYI